MKRFFAFLAVVSVITLAGHAKASLVMSTVNVAVVEDFNGMPTSGTIALTATVGTQNALSGSGFEGTKIAGTGTVLNLVASDGSANSGALYSDGTGTASDRALGAIASGTTITAYGVELINSTGTALTSVDLSFRREQWRSSTSTMNILSFFSAVSGGATTSANYLTSAGMTALTSCDLVGDAPVVANGAVDGNVDFVNVACTVTAAIPAGSSLYIRWTDTNDVGNDANLAVDDLNVTPRPEPATLAMLAFGGLVAIRRRR